ncbi:MAG: hypothetical protein AAGG01_16445 [Planctomycetota bacterium]
MTRSRTLPALAAAISLALSASSLSLAQLTTNQAGNAAPSSSHLRPDSAFTVDPSGSGDFASLQEAVNSVPSGALVLLVPGTFAGADIHGMSLRVESVVPGSSELTGPLTVTGVGLADEVSLGGLLFTEGFRVENCAGDVTLTGCLAINDGAPALYPPGLNGGFPGHCGSGTSRHRIINSEAVTLVGCSLAGRKGAEWGCDGTPGEHALMVEGSRVAIYGGTFDGGNGGNGYDCHGVWGGSGGDALWVDGAKSRVFHRSTVLNGGTGGLNISTGAVDGCNGDPVRTYAGATVDEDVIASLTFDIDALTRPDQIASYTLTAPPGAEIYLMLAPRRSWREFVTEQGLLHLDSSLQLVPLGVMGSSGTLTRPFPTPSPAWRSGFASVEVQAYARVAGEDRYSEPRTLQATYVGQ